MTGAGAATRSAAATGCGPLAAAAAGRDPAALEISAYGCPPNKDLLARLRDAGVQRAVFFAPSAERDVVLPILDTYAELLRSVG